MEKVITQSKGGAAERQTPINQVKIPDLWHIAMLLKDHETDLSLGHNHLQGQSMSDAVLECWHTCHDLKRHIQEEDS